MTTQAIPAPIESHEVHSERLLRHAHIELEKGDRLQASEKAWGAGAHMIKVVAAHRGWKYKTHSDAYRIIRRLIAETGDDRLQLVFSAANYLHQNYYIDGMPLDEIRVHLEYVEELVEILKGIIERG